MSPAWCREPLLGAWCRAGWWGPRASCRGAAEANRKLREQARGEKAVGAGVPGPAGTLGRTPRKFAKQMPWG